MVRRLVDVWWAVRQLIQREAHGKGVGMAQWALSQWACQKWLAKHLVAATNDVQEQEELLNLATPLPISFLLRGKQCNHSK